VKSLEKESNPRAKPASVPAIVYGTADSAVRMYFAGIYLLKDVFEKQQKGGAFNLNLAKRWMQSIFNQIVDDESFVYGLTNIKNYDDYTLNHSINVCILAVALPKNSSSSKVHAAYLSAQSRWP